MHYRLTWAALEKAISHKYTRKYKDAKGKWRYIYPGGDRHGKHSVEEKQLIGTANELHKGASFSAGKGKGHWIVLGVDRHNGRVRVQLDEGADGAQHSEQKYDIDTFFGMVKQAHKSGIENHALNRMDKRLSLLKRAQAAGATEAQIQRAKDEVSAWRDSHKKLFSGDYLKEINAALDKPGPEAQPQPEQTALAELKRGLPTQGKHEEIDPDLFNLGESRRGWLEALQKRIDKTGAPIEVKAIFSEKFQGDGSRHVLLAHKKTGAVRRLEVGKPFDESGPFEYDPKTFILQTDLTEDKSIKKFRMFEERPPTPAQPQPVAPQPPAVPVAKLLDPELEKLEKAAREGELDATQVKKLSRLRKRPLSPNVSVALSPDKKMSFHTRHKVVDLFDLVTSHDMDGRQRKDYDQALQSRHRGSIADSEQIRRMASGLEPMALLYDSRRTDEGSPIIGEDGMVESGNGRSLAMMWAAKGNNEAWQRYQEEIKDYLPMMGISEADLEGKKFPVVVRERVTGDGNKDFRVHFAEAANTSSIKRMSSFEEAQRDSRRISPKMIENLRFNPDESVESALSRHANKHIAGEYLDALGQNEGSALMDENGDLSKHGRERFKAAMYLYAMPGKSGEMIARTFVESSDYDLKNFDNAFSRSLPALAKTRSLFNEGKRDASLDLMPDLAASIQALDDLKRQDLPVDAYLAQDDLFAAHKMTSPLQDKMLKKIDEIKRSPKKMRELLASYNEVIESEPDARPEGRKVAQLDLLGSTIGGEYAPTKKKGLGSTEAVWDKVVENFDAKQAPAGQRSLF